MQAIRLAKRTPRPVLLGGCFNTDFAGDAMPDVARIFVVGYPSSLGGADTELWHVLKLWRSHQIDVTLVPTWSPPYGWRQRCDEIGARTIQLEGPELLADVPGLAGSTVISFCNGQFLAHAAVFRQLRCRVVWVGCMTYLFNAEIAHYREYGPFDAYVFQSRFQRTSLLPQLATHGVSTKTCFLIRGAFDAAEFPFAPRPHTDQGTFFVGRLSRIDRHKWHTDTWKIYEEIPWPRVRARVMGWGEAIQEHVGTPPSWVETLSPCDETPQTFLASLHCHLALNGLATENWPRVGLEAMAAGVPVIAERRGGWSEMIEHGETGFLAERPEQASQWAGKLAKDEDLRMEIAHAARARLSDVADHEDIWRSWKRLFQSLP